MRIVHLIEPGLCGSAGGAGACPFRIIAELARRQPQTQHDTIILGRSPEDAIAERAGIKPSGLLCVPALRPMSAKAALAEILRPMEFAGDPFTIIHSWSPRATALAALTAPHRPRLGTILNRPDRTRDSRVFPGVMNRVPTRLLVASETIRDAWSAAGVPSMSMSVSAPGAVCEWLDPAARKAVRAAWDEDGALNDDVFVVGILADHPAGVDARLAFEIVGRLALGGRAVRMILHPHARHRAESERAARRINLDHLMIQDSAVSEPWRVLAGLDVALALAGSSQWSTLWTCAAGVACILERSAWIDQVSRDSTGAARNETSFSEFAKGHVNGATALLSALCDDVAARQASADSAARLVHQRFDFQAFADRFEHACDEAFNERGLRRNVAVAAVS